MPIVTDYALIYAYAIDPQNREFKAPFNQLKPSPSC